MSEYTYSLVTIKDLKRFIQQQAIVNSVDYGGDTEALAMDRNHVRKNRKALRKVAGLRWHMDDDRLLIGEYFGGRLIITHDSIDYIAGQYAPVEIHHAAMDYFERLSEWNKTIGRSNNVNVS